MTTILESLKNDIVRLEAQMGVKTTPKDVGTDWKAIAIEATDILADIVPAYYDTRAGVTEVYERAKDVIAKVQAAQ
jgi:hypothetical protein